MQWFGLERMQTADGSSLLFITKKGKFFSIPVSQGRQMQKVWGEHPNAIVPNKFVKTTEKMFGFDVGLWHAF